MFYDFSLDVFNVTCGRSGVGSITTIDVHIDGTDGWLFNWIEIETGFETSRFESNVYVDDYETVRFFRSPMNARKSHSLYEYTRASLPQGVTKVSCLHN